MTSTGKGEDKGRMIVWLGVMVAAMGAAVRSDAIGSFVGAKGCRSGRRRHKNMLQEMLQQRDGAGVEGVRGQAEPYGLCPARRSGGIVCCKLRLPGRETPSPTGERPYVALNPVR